MIAIVIVVRFLGVDNYGRFSSLLAIVGILARVVDFGIEPIVFREFAKDKDNYHIFSAGLNLRFVLYIILVAGFNLAAPFIAFSAREILLTNILFTTIIFSAKMVIVRESMSTPFKVNLKMHYPMLLAIFDNLVLLILILFIPIMKDPVLYFVIVYAASNIPGFVLSFYYLWKKFGYKYEFTLERGMWLLKESLPLFGFVVLTNIFLQLDVVILDSFKGHYDVGIYSAGARLTMPLSIIPGAIVTTVFPILVKRLSGKENTEFITNMVIKLLYFISFVIAAVFTFESSSLVTIIFGNQFAATAYSASILYWCQIFLFFGFYSLSVLIADNKQHYNFLYAGIQAGVNVLFCFILIPQYSFVGASIAKLIASFVSFIFILFALNKFGFRPSVGRYRMLLWSLVLACSLWALSLLPVIPYLFLSGIAVVVLTLYLKFFTKQEILIFFKLVNKENLFNKYFVRMHD